MRIDPQTLELRQVYQLLTSTVVPRPIAWVSSVAEDGSLNLAPFSYFMAITHDPPLIAFAANWRRTTNNRKDTLANIEATGEFVLNVVTDETVEKMNQTSGEYSAEVDEFEVAGLTPVAASVVRPPRVAEAPVQMECKLEQVVYLGRDTTPTGLVIGRIVMWHVRDDLLTPEGVVDPHKLQPVGRLSGNYYSHIHDLFAFARPKV